MTISKERMNELEVFAWEHSHGNTPYMKTKAYGRALLKAVEQESEIVGKAGVKLIALPLVSEE